MSWTRMNESASRVEPALRVELELGFEALQSPGPQKLKN